MRKNIKNGVAVEGSNASDAPANQKSSTNNTARNQ